MKNKNSQIFQIGIVSLVLNIVGIIAIIVQIVLAINFLKQNINDDPTNNDNTINLNIGYPISVVILLVFAIIDFIIVDILNIFICIYIGIQKVNNNEKLSSQKILYLVFCIIFTILFTIIPPILAIVWAHKIKKNIIKIAEI